MQTMRSTWTRIVGLLDRWLVLPAPIVLAAMSAYFLFIVIIPFHILRIDKVAGIRVASGEVSLGHALGEPFAAIGFLLEILMWSIPLVSVLWMLSLVNAIQTRKWYVLLILALAPLPLAYFNAGPHAPMMKDWVEAL